MKLRMHDNTVRVRLNRREVDRFAQSGVVEDIMAFPNPLHYALIADGGLKSRAIFEEGRIEIRIPAGTANAWANSEEVGIAAQDGNIDILIEKDFHCLHKEGSDDPDAYPNPAET
jgi:hypothetical protein